MGFSEYGQSDRPRSGIDRPRSGIERPRSGIKSPGPGGDLSPAGYSDASGESDVALLSAGDKTGPNSADELGQTTDQSEQQDTVDGPAPAKQPSQSPVPPPAEPSPSPVPPSAEPAITALSDVREEGEEANKQVNLANANHTTKPYYAFMQRAIHILNPSCLYTLSQNVDDSISVST
jgi:hypothetical protein